MNITSSSSNLDAFHRWQQCYPWACKIQYRNWCYQIGISHHNKGWSQRSWSRWLTSTTISISTIGDYENYDIICDRSWVVTFPSEDPSPNTTVTEDGGENTDIDLWVRLPVCSHRWLPQSVVRAKTRRQWTRVGLMAASVSEEPSPNPIVTEDGDPSRSMTPSLAPSISSENEEPSSNPSLQERDGTNRIISASKIAKIGPLSFGCFATDSSHWCNGLKKTARMNVNYAELSYLIFEYCHIVPS